jgi:hypothetical protein
MTVGHVVNRDVALSLYPRLLLAALVSVMCFLATPMAADAAAPDKGSAHPARVGTGALSLTIAGLPRGEHARVLLVGPRSSGVRRHLKVKGSRVVRRLPVGSYTVIASPVKIRRRHQSIKRGATATPEKKRHRVKINRRGPAKLEVRYGAIVNPGIRSVSGHVASVIGSPSSPKAVVLEGVRGIRRGAILSARPGGALPRGLLSRVSSIARKKNRIKASLVPASIYDVAPNMSFDVPLSATEAARVSAAFECGPSGSSFSPYARISDIRLTGHWTTTRVLFADITNGATLELHFKASAGVDVTAGGAFSCSVSLPAIGVQGMAGPIPVYGAIRPQASGEVAAQGKINASGSTNVTLGTSVQVPGAARPIIGFDSPRFAVDASLFTGVKAKVGIDAELGVGAANIANLHLKVGSSLDFTAGPGSCSWDLNLGAFGVEGKIGPADIDGPSRPPAYHRNLWRRPCGAAPTPPPPPPPPPPGPLTRAVMDWETDSDIDLYVWDAWGNETYFDDLDAIPDTQLIQDVIPGSGEYLHSSEIFQELAEFNRPYTFGICNYRGDETDVTLTVTDPGGATRAYGETLYFEGDGVVITSSPLGADYSPPWGWCRSATS